MEPQWPNGSRVDVLGETGFRCPSPKIAKEHIAGGPLIEFRDYMDRIAAAINYICMVSLRSLFARFCSLSLFAVSPRVPGREVRDCDLVACTC